jgi:hypothetical protein
VAAVAVADADMDGDQAGSATERPRGSCCMLRSSWRGIFLWLCLTRPWICGRHGRTLRVGSRGRPEAFTPVKCLKMPAERVMTTLNEVLTFHRARAIDGAVEIFVDMSVFTNRMECADEENWANNHKQGRVRRRCPCGISPGTYCHRVKVWDHGEVAGEDV